MTPSLPYSLWADLLGKPFRLGGRGPDAYDCVGLLLELERRLGNELPPWGSHARHLPGARAHWLKVSNPMPGDAILIRSDDARIPWHIGVVCGAGWMIHAHTSAGVSRERHDAFPWQAQIEGFYRWKQDLYPPDALQSASLKLPHPPPS